MGKLITFEGIDGSGKTTQISLLEHRLRKENIPFITLREPGSTSISEEIRRVLLKHRQAQLSPIAETLLFVTARTQLVTEQIQPHMKQNKIVICDRYIDSTIAYQGYGKGLDLKFLKTLNKFGTYNILPSLTIILDINPEKAAERIVNVDQDRMESLGLDFFKRVQNGYHQIANEEPERCVVIDSEKSIGDISKEIFNNARKIVRSLDVIT